MKRTLAAAIAALLLASVAYAQTTTAPDTSVTIPYGDWLNEIRATLLYIVIGIVAWAFRKLPTRISDLLKIIQAEQLLKRAIEYAINTTADAAKGKALKVDVANEVVRKVAQFAIDRGPAWLVAWLGGRAGIEQMAIARIQVEPKAEVIDPPNAAAGISPILTKAE